MNDNYLSDDRRAMHDPVFHYRLHHPVNDCPFYDRLHNLSFNNSTLYARVHYVTLDDPALHARRFVLIINLDASTRGATVKYVIIFQPIPAPELSSGRSGSDYGRRRIRECGQPSYGKCLHNRS